MAKLHRIVYTGPQPQEMHCTVTLTDKAPPEEAFAASEGIVARSAPGQRRGVLVFWDAIPEMVEAAAAISPAFAKDCLDALSRAAETRAAPGLADPSAP